LASDEPDRWRIVSDLPSAVPVLDEELALLEQHLGDILANLMAEQTEAKDQ